MILWIAAIVLNGCFGPWHKATLLLSFASFGFASAGGSCNCGPPFFV
jgi:hypothetical protein